MLRRLAALLTWVSEGHNLIVVLEDFAPLKISRDNRAVMFDLKKHELLSPISDFKQIIGERVECIGEQNEFLAQLSEYLSYRDVLTSTTAGRLLRVARSTDGADQVVGLTIRRGKGRLFFMPPPKPAALDFCITIFAQLPDDEVAEAAELPEWVAEYENAGEAKASVRISELLRQIDERQREVETCRQALATSAWIKQLFAGSGDSFADAVARALKEMGLEVEPGPHPRADLLIRDGNNIGATEVKGLDGIARENNLRQTERWTAEVNAALASSAQEREADPDLVRYGEVLTALKIPLDGTHQTNCKGIMIVGTYRKVPLVDRTDVDFPDAVLRIAEREQICALTGLDLLVWLLVAQSDPAQKDVFRGKLFSTNGRLKAPADWTSVLHKK